MFDGQFFLPFIYDLIVKATCILPENVMNALESAYGQEIEFLAKVQMETTVHHMRLSKEKMIPITKKLGLDIDYTQYKPLINWEPCSIHKETNPKYPYNDT